MSTRTSSLILLPLLAACGGGVAKPPEVAEQECGLERVSEEGRAAFVLRHPDGKFRRLVASADGQQLLAADGADQSQSARKSGPEGERWEVILGDDRYVVPVQAPNGHTDVPQQ